MRFVDSHLHLDSPDADQLVALARADGILLMACGTNRETSELVLRSAASVPETVRAFVGVHPSEASPGTSLDWLSGLLGRASGLGEVGLDPRYSEVGPRGAQMAALQGQLEVAGRLGKPVQVHSRDAEMECLEALGSAGVGPVLMHWFQKEEALAEVLDRGYFVSFGPAVLYSKKAQRMASRCGPAQALPESDSPVPYRPLGGAHGPSLVPSVVFKLAEVWRVSFEEAGLALADNAARFLGSSEKG